jgi:hypothetical protein
LPLIPLPLPQTTPSLKFGILESRNIVSVPDPDWIRLQVGQWNPGKEKDIFALFWRTVFSLRCFLLSCRIRRTLTS